MIKIVVAITLFAFAAVLDAGEMSVRPSTWAQPVGGTGLKNLFRVSDELYRSEQPDVSAVASLKAMGIRSMISFRSVHNDAAEFERQGISTFRCPMSAGSLSRADIIKALRVFQAAPKPVLVHCWHGSDRTGAVVAAYRMIFQNWTAADAIRELREGGYGFHEIYLKHMLQVLEHLDAPEIRKALSKEKPNQSPEPTGMLVTPRADARVAPSTPVAHL